MASAALRWRNSLYRMSCGTFYLMLNVLAVIRFPQHVVTARLMTRRYEDALLTFEERELFLLGILYMTGFAQTGFPIQKLARA
jgi:putative glycosyltransferase